MLTCPFTSMNPTSSSGISLLLSAIVASMLSFIGTLYPALYLNTGIRLIVYNTDYSTELVR